MIPTYNDPYAKLDPVPKAETEAGLQRLPRWRDSALGWNLDEVQAAIDRREYEKLIGHLLTIFPTLVADALKALNVPPIRRGIQAQHRIEEGVSQCVWHARRHLPDLLKGGRTPQELAGYYRLRARSLVEDSLQESVGRVRKHKRSSLDDYHDRPPRYREATKLMADLAVRMSPDDMRSVLSAILAGHGVREAIRHEVNRRIGQPAYPRTDEACRAGIYRQLVALGAAVTAAAPDWALDAWFQVWGGRLSWTPCMAA